MIRYFANDSNSYWLHCLVSELSLDEAKCFLAETLKNEF